MLPSVLMYVDEHWIIKVLSNAPSVESVSPFVDGNDFYTHRAFFALFILNTLGYFAWFANRIIWFTGLYAVTVPESISDQRLLKRFTGTVTVFFHSVIMDLFRFGCHFFSISTVRNPLFGGMEGCFMHPHKKKSCFIDEASAFLLSVQTFLRDNDQCVAAENKI